MNELGYGFNPATDFHPWRLETEALSGVRPTHVSIQPRIFTRGDYWCGYWLQLGKIVSIQPRIFTRGDTPVDVFAG